MKRKGAFAREVFRKSPVMPEPRLVACMVSIEGVSRTVSRQHLNRSTGEKVRRGAGVEGAEALVHVFSIWELTE